MRAILPAGEGQTATATDFATFTAHGTPPDSFLDEAGPFNALVGDATHLGDGLIEQDFPASSRALDGPATATQTPEPGVTISWDALGVPHVVGQTEDEVMFGAGYAQAEARLFAMDVLRHLGKGMLTRFLGPGVGNVNLTSDANVLAQSDCTPAERETEVTNLTGRPPSSSRRCSAPGSPPARTGATRTATTRPSTRRPGATAGTGRSSRTCATC